MQASTDRLWCPLLVGRAAEGLAAPFCLGASSSDPSDELELDESESESELDESESDEPELDEESESESDELSSEEESSVKQQLLMLC